ncbi:MAG: hypothetical protein DRJ66_04075 [Thermoprotei archaeon]|nr:MAG: hypothetical protein DRJ66_04075 [Thermoprotei archaeon]RLF19478.1 MAG: hypothetical protein DRZ82_05580 [Thermoprotei archaeon]
MRLTWFLEGNLSEEFIPRRMLIVYESSSPLDVIVSFKAPEDLIIKSTKPGPLIKKEDLYFWRPLRDIRNVNGKLIYLYSVHLNVGGTFLSECLRCKVEDKIYGEETYFRNLKIRYSFSYKDLEKVRLVIGPLKPIIMVSENPRGSLRKWNIRGIGDVYFLTFDNLPSSLNIEYRIPKHTHSVIAARIEGESFDKDRVMIRVLNANTLAEIESLESKGRIIAYLEDLFL